MEYGKCNVREEEFKNKILSKFASIREGEGKFKYNYMINNHKSVGEGKFKFNNLVNCHKSDGDGKITIIYCLIARAI